MTTGRWMFACGAVAAGGVLAAAAWTRDDQPAERFVYGQIAIDDGQAVLVTDRVVQRIEIPLQPADANSRTVFRNALGPYQKQFNPLLYTLSVFGSEGWEVIDGSVPLREGERVLVRRRVR